MGRSHSVIAQAGQASMGRAGSSHLGNVARWGGQSDVTTKEPARNDQPARSQPDGRAGSLSLRPLCSFLSGGRETAFGGVPPPRTPIFCNKQVSCILL